MHERIEAGGGTCYSLNLRRAVDAFSATMRLHRLIQREKIDLLHTHLFHPLVLGYIAARLLPGRRPVIVHTRHCTDEMHRYHSRGKALLDGALARKQDHIFAISQASVDVLVNLDHVNAKKISINRPAVIIDKFRALVDPAAAIALRQSVGATGIVIGIVSRLVEKKGHKFLLDITPTLVERSPGLKILIIGDGPERGALEQQTIDLSLQDTVKFLGYRSDIATIVSALDILVQPSLEEGLPVTLIEAMALGKPVVASRISGIPELITDHETGLLCESGNSTDLLNAVSELLLDPALRKRIAALGQRLVECEYTMARHARLYEEGWARMLDNNGSHVAATPIGI
jgi:glycosyltransferase involved in cell wall biosynthesis